MAPSSSQYGRDWRVTQLVGGEQQGEIGLHINALDTLFMHSAVCCVRYSSDGAALIAGGNHYARIFDSDTGELISTLHLSGAADAASTRADNHCRATCFSPDYEYVMTCCDGEDDAGVKVWSFEESRVDHTFDEHSAPVCGLDVSHDSRFVASADSEGILKLWELGSGKLLNTLGGIDEESGFTSVAISPSMRLVAAGCLDRTVKVWDVETGTVVSEYGGHSNSVYSVSFTSDGGCVISGSLDSTAKVWDLSEACEARCRKTLRGHEDFVLAVTVSADDGWFITGSKDRSVRFWDARRDDVAVQLSAHSNSVISVAHDPCANNVATGSGDQRVRTWCYE